MTWMRCLNGYRLDPIAAGFPEALVVLLHDLGASAVLMPVAARWATAVPTAAFIALDGIDQDASDLHTIPVRDAKAQRARLDCATRRLAAQLEQQLCCWRLDASRLVLVGFDYGGTVALNMVRHRWNCAGILAFAATLMRPLPRIVRVAHKVRLIGFGAQDISRGGLRYDVALLTARGIDTRGVLLPGSGLSQEAIRHGGAYLVELVATAQRGARFHGKRTGHGSPSGKRI
jgi:predicted esterase